MHLWQTKVSSDNAKAIMEKPVQRLRLQHVQYECDLVTQKSLLHFITAK